MHQVASSLSFHLQLMLPDYGNGVRDGVGAYGMGGYGICVGANGIGVYGIGVGVDGIGVGAYGRGAYDVGEGAHGIHWRVSVWHWRI